MNATWRMVSFSDFQIADSYVESLRPTRALPNIVRDPLVEAIADFFLPWPEPPRSVKEAKKAMEAVDAIQTAHWFLFDETPDVFNFRGICERAGFDREACRKRLLRLRFLGEHEDRKVCEDCGEEKGLSQFYEASRSRCRLCTIKKVLGRLQQKKSSVGVV